MSLQHSRTCLRLRILLFLLSLGLTATALDSPAIAKGTDWHIDFGDSSAEADGTVTFTFTMNQGTEKSVTLDVEEGWGPDYKAGQLNDLIDPTNELESHVESNNHKVWVETDDNWENDDRITELTHEDSGTGEGITHHSDDAPVGPQVIVSAVVNIQGLGTGGTLGIGIGSDLGQLVSVDVTNGKTGSEIEQELLDAFNLAYAGFYVATIENGWIVIPNIPCPLGVLFGTTDTGLSYSFSMRQTNTSVPALTGWGGLVLFGLIVIAAVMVMQRRRHAVA